MKAPGWRSWFGVVQARVPLVAGLLALCGLAACASDPTAIAQVRVARATHRLDAIVAFYRDGLGLPVLGGFEGHTGYDGVMVGLPDDARHLEWTESAEHEPSRAGPEDLLVLYYEDRQERDRVVARLSALGHRPIPPANPYWLDKAVTVADPDGFRVVLFAGRWDPSAASIPPRFLAPGTEGGRTP